MPSLALPAPITLNDSVALIRDQFECEHRGKVVAKGKGEIDMYFIACPRAAG